MKDLDQEYEIWGDWEKGKTPHAKAMNETIETEMNMVYLWDLRGNSPPGAEVGLRVGLIE